MNCNESKTGVLYLCIPTSQKQHTQQPNQTSGRKNATELWRGSWWLSYRHTLWGQGQLPQESSKSPDGSPSHGSNNPVSWNCCLGYFFFCTWPLFSQSAPSFVGIASMIHLPLKCSNWNQNHCKAWTLTSTRLRIKTRFSHGRHGTWRTTGIKTGCPALTAKGTQGKTFLKVLTLLNGICSQFTTWKGDRPHTPQ